MHGRIAGWSLFFYFFVLSLPAIGIQKQHYLDGMVVNVSNDCLLIVSIDHKAEIVRLADIVYPDQDERALQAIVEFTRSMVMDKKIRIHNLGRNARGNILGRVFIDERCLNRELLMTGLVLPRLSDNAAVDISIH